MFWKSTKDPEIDRRVAQEVQSICRQAQIQLLTMTPHMRKDIGLDCGCGFGTANGRAI